MGKPYLAVPQSMPLVEGRLNPPPVAPHQQIVQWLTGLRKAALLLTVSLLAVPLLMSLLLLTSQANRLVTNIPYIALAALQAVAIWKITTSEPDNELWLRLPRIFLRVSCIVLVLLPLYTLSSELFSIRKTALRDLAGIVVIAGHLIFFWYMKQLSIRLEHNGLRKNFATIVAVLELLLFGALISHFSGSQLPEPGIGHQDRTVSQSQEIWIILIISSVCAWVSLLMWRIARLLKKAERRYSDAGLTMEQ